VVQLVREEQLAEALQVRIESPNKGEETSLITFPPTKDPQAEAEGQALRSLLSLRPGLNRFQVYYGGYSGRDDEISMMPRSILELMLELAFEVEVPETDAASGKVFPGMVEGQIARTRATPAVTVLSGNKAPTDASTAVEFNVGGSGSPKRISDPKAFLGP